MGEAVLSIVPAWMDHQIHERSLREYFEEIVNKTAETDALHLADLFIKQIDLGREIEEQRTIIRRLGAGDREFIRDQRSKIPSK